LLYRTWIFFKEGDKISLEKRNRTPLMMKTKGKFSFLKRKVSTRRKQHQNIQKFKKQKTNGFITETIEYYEEDNNLNQIKSKQKRASKPNFLPDYIYY